MTDDMTCGLDKGGTSTPRRSHVENIEEVSRQK